MAILNTRRVFLSLKRLLKAEPAEHQVRTARKPMHARPMAESRIPKAFLARLFENTPYRVIP